MVIGAGYVGGTLGTAWAQKAGHEIFFGVRNPTFDQTQAAVRRLDGKARRHAGTSSGIRSIHRADDAMECGRSSNPIDGRFERNGILDATNPLAMGPDGFALEIGHNISAGEKVQGWAKRASVFKTLNTTGFGNMANPIFRGVKSVMFVAGDDAANRSSVVELVAALGFEVVDAGPLRNVRLLEAHCMLWIDLAFTCGLGRDFAFAVVRR